jgi:hypothetical protein
LFILLAETFCCKVSLVEISGASKFQLPVDTCIAPVSSFIIYNIPHNYFKVKHRIKNPSEKNGKRKNFYMQLSGKMLLLDITLFVSDLLCGSNITFIT